ncbi:MAG: hypothetical protein H7Y89_04330, partial [Steroidobacteraceae bacterium]|nr:hypothetical protein [Steroidobacteraceae bacterium]
DFGCDAGKLTGRGGLLGVIDMSAKVALNTDTGVTTFHGSGLAVAGTTADIDARLDATGWRAQARTGTATLTALRKFAEPWFKLPAEFTAEGKAVIEGTIADAGKGIEADGSARFTDVAFTNEAGDLVGEKIDVAARLRARPRAASTDLEIDVAGTRGESFLSIVYFDFTKNPLALSLKGSMAGDKLSIASLHLTQRDLADMRAVGVVDLKPEVPTFTGDVKIERLQFPAAYGTYMANVLASSILGDLETSGSLTGEVALVDSGVRSLHLVPRDLNLRDRKGQLTLTKVGGEIFWAPAGGGDARASTLSWTEGGAYGLSGGAAKIDFVAYGMNFALTQPTKLPIFDGALAIDHFVMGNLGAPDMEVAFKGAIEPISMSELAKAFAWPEFKGTLAAQIPSVRLKDNVLTFDGNVESNVFGGRVTGSNIRLQDPLGNFPQFFADVRARDLDLGLVTQTFEVGTITGKLEADILGLELFAWSPVAFDARLATPAGDKSRHRISAKAVSSLSNVGGGGGGVVQALQSGVLKFFDEYNYEKLGIRCRLKGNVCEMSGVEPAPNGYYIVKGSGLPRIDIVGNQGRVSWNQLLSSIPTDASGIEVK